MQRFLSLVTLVVLLGLGWFFASNFRVEGLRNVEIKPRSESHPETSMGTSTVSTGMVPVTPLPKVARQGESIKIASFHIQDFGEMKASKPRVMGILAAIIQRFDVIAVQSIRGDKGEYLIRDFIHQINIRNQRHYEYVIGPRLGQSDLEQYAFLYDAASVEPDLAGAYTISDPSDVLLREPLVVPFRVRGPAADQAFTFILINVHINPDAVAQEVDLLADVFHAVRQASRSEDDIMILGNLNSDNRHLGRLGEIPGIYPLIQNRATNTLQTQESSNIILHKPSTVEFTGRAGVLDVMRTYNLNTDQALAISDHLPIWAEFSLAESAGARSQIARQPKDRWGW
ncbi:MAG: endonuclease/exonuclease/phosphatase [Pirellulales bacterium]|nr:endonuclease/exonuclease/phosphatase [Pirellulales bacterium]